MVRSDEPLPRRRKERMPSSSESMEGPGKNGGPRRRIPGDCTDIRNDQQALGIVLKANCLHITWNFELVQHGPITSIPD